MRLIPVLAIALLVKSVNDDNKIMLYISFAIFPLMGIFITPNVIIYAIKDSKKDESKFLSKMNRLDKRFVITEDKERYHLKILFA